MWGDEHREHPEIPAILVLLEGLFVEETSLSIMGLSVAMTMTEISASPEVESSLHMCFFVWLGQR